MRENNHAYSTAMAQSTVVTSLQCQPNILEEKDICEAKGNLMN